MPRLHGLIFSVACLACLPAGAQTVYRCAEANGKVVFGNQPCRAMGSSGVQTEIELPKHLAPLVDNVPAAPAKPLPPPQTAPAAPAKTPAAPAYVPAAVDAATPIRPAPVRKLTGAVIVFYYDPTDAPAEHPQAKVESIIRNAAAAWSAGCMVELKYAGTAPYAVPGTPERVSIRWSPELLHAKHPAHSGRGLAGIGSMKSGIRLRPRVSDKGLVRVITHEMGHVLGLRHNHEDLKSVMSYLSEEGMPRASHPSASDYEACDTSMARMFGGGVNPPAATQPPARRMTDREALEKRYGPQP